MSILSRILTQNHQAQQLFNGLLYQGSPAGDLAASQGKTVTVHGGHITINANRNAEEAEKILHQCQERNQRGLGKAGLPRVTRRRRSRKALGGLIVNG